MVSGLLLLATLLGAVGARPGAPADTVGDSARRLLREARVAVERDEVELASASDALAVNRSGYAFYEDE